MAGFFHRSDSERKRIELILLELAKVGALINGYEKQRNGYTVGKQFELGWIFYTASNGSISDEIVMRETYTTVRVLERVLYRQIESLKKYESVHRDKNGK